MNKTNIAYLDYTWNPIKMTCSQVSAACKNCWHLTWGKRFQKVYDKPVLDEKELFAPLKLNKFSRIGVQFMGDLFHEAIEEQDQYRILDAIGKMRRHIFFILTKRSNRMHQILTEYSRDDEGNCYLRKVFPHMWLGVSVEDQKTWDKRVLQLLEIDHPNRYVSIEPLLGNIDFNPLLSHAVPHWPKWIIVGGETGAGYRECKIEWIDHVAYQCNWLDIPCYVKQDSGPRPGMQGRIPDELWKMKEAP